ncbi:MAG: tripartite tricarboxylate transporter substrate binding protein [Betaproteobacteria bacterium]|nr:tripartite tricarboxylate transporter substrate binding protein [Betaproteobacteria bacterium]
MPRIASTAWRARSRRGRAMADAALPAQRMPSIETLRQPGIARGAGVVLAGCLLASATLPWVARDAAAADAATDYPQRPIRAVVPSPAGGPPDLILRMLAPKLAASLGQQVVIDNRAGAGGVVGTATVARAAPDGYTWLFTTASHTNTPPFNKNVPFDPVKDFSHVSLVAQNFGQALVVPPSSPAKTVQELIAIARQNPGKLNYATAGLGTASHIPAEVMKSMAGVDIVGVQYKGTSLAMGDVLAGRVDMLFIGTNVAVTHVNAGRLRALALTGAKRWKGMPDVPTMQEAGLAGYNIINWFGLWLPAGAAPNLITRLHAEFVRALSDPEIRQQFDAQGLEGVGMPPKEFAEFVRRQSEFMHALARKIESAPKPEAKTP